jgi:gas vesicle protein
MSMRNVLYGVLAGFVAGSAIGVLFAPSKGSSTRKRLLRKGDKYSDELEEKFNDILTDITNKYEDVKAEARRSFENGKVKKETIQHDVK